MNHYILALAIGFGAFMAFAIWCVYIVLKTAHDEDPGCLDPRH